MIMVTSFVTPLGVMLTFTSALPWCLVATTHRSVIRTEGRFYCFCLASRYIRTKLRPRKVEEAAVSLVSETYQREGWQVESVEQKRCSFDLPCVRDGEEAHVEVKGVVSHPRGGVTARQGIP